MQHDLGHPPFSTQILQMGRTTAIASSIVRAPISSSSIIPR